MIIHQPVSSFTVGGIDALGQSLFVSSRLHGCQGNGWERVGEGNGVMQSLFVCLFVCLSVCWFVCLFVCLLFVCCLFVCLSVCLVLFSIV